MTRNKIISGILILISITLALTDPAPHLDSFSAVASELGRRISWIVCGMVLSQTFSHLQRAAVLFKGKAVGGYSQSYRAEQKALHTSAGAEETLCGVFMLVIGVLLISSALDFVILKHYFPSAVKGGDMVQGSLIVSAAICAIFCNSVTKRSATAIQRMGGRL